MSYKQSMIAHSQKRGAERYGMYVGSEFYAINNTLKVAAEQSKFGKGLATFLFYQRRKLHLLLWWRNKYIWVVWNDELKCTHTLLPIEGLSKYFYKMSNSTLAKLVSMKIIENNNDGTFKLLI